MSYSVQDDKCVVATIDAPSQVPTPPRIALVFDVSGSMLPYYRLIRTIMQMIAQEVQNANLPAGLVRLIAFSDRIKLDVDAASPHAESTIAGAAFNGGTRFKPALNRCLTLNATIVFFMTDGVAEDIYKLASIAANLRHKEIVVHPVFYQENGTSMPPRVAAVFNQLSPDSSAEGLVSSVDRLKLWMLETIFAAGQDITGTITVNGKAHPARFFTNDETVMAVTIEPVSGPIEAVGVQGCGVSVTDCQLVENAADTVTAALHQATCATSLCERARQALSARPMDAKVLRRIAADLKKVGGTTTLRDQVVEAMVACAESAADPTNTVDPAALQDMLRRAIAEGLWHGTKALGKARRQERNAMAKVASIVTGTAETVTGKTGAVQAARRALAGTVTHPGGAPDDAVLLSSIMEFVFAVVAGSGQELARGCMTVQTVATMTNFAAAAGHLSALLGYDTYCRMLDGKLTLYRADMPAILHSDGSPRATRYIELTWRLTAMQIAANVVGEAPVSAQAMWAAFAFSLLLKEPEHAQLATVHALADYHAAGTRRPEEVVARTGNPLGVVLSNSDGGDRLVQNVGTALVRLFFEHDFAPSAAGQCPRAAVFENARQMITRPISTDPLLAALGAAPVVATSRFDPEALLSLSSAEELLGALTVSIDREFVLPAEFKKLCRDMLLGLEPAHGSGSSFVQPAAVSWEALATAFGTLRAMPPTEARHSNGGYLPSFDMPPAPDGDALARLLISDDDAVLMALLLVWSGGVTTKLRSRDDIDHTTQLSNALVARLLPEAVVPQQLDYQRQTLGRLARIASPSQLGLIIEAATRIKGAIGAVVTAVLGRDGVRPEWVVIGQLLRAATADEGTDEAPLSNTIVTWVCSARDADDCVQSGMPWRNYLPGAPLRQALLAHGADPAELDKLSRPFMAHAPSMPGGRGHGPYARMYKETTCGQETPAEGTRVTLYADPADFDEDSKTPQHQFTGDRASTLFAPDGVSGGATRIIFTIRWGQPVLTDIEFRTPLRQKTVYSRAPDKAWDKVFIGDLMAYYHENRASRVTGSGRNRHNTLQF